MFMGRVLNEHTKTTLRDIHRNTKTTTKIERRAYAHFASMLKYTMRWK